MGKLFTWGIFIKSAIDQKNLKFSVVIALVIWGICRVHVCLHVCMFMDVCMHYAGDDQQLNFCKVHVLLGWLFDIFGSYFPTSTTCRVAW